MVLQLSFNDFLRLHGAQGAAIEVLDGKVWITEDGRTGDLFLEPGRSYRVAGSGLVVVGAEDRLRYARVIVRKAAAGGLWGGFGGRRQGRRTPRPLGEPSEHILKENGPSRGPIPVSGRSSSSGIRAPTPPAAGS